MKILFQLRGALVAGAALATLTPSSAPAAPNGDELFDALSRVAAEEMRALGIPGAALGVLHEGRRYTRGFGVTNADHPLTVTDETLFQIGSITKTFTGTLLASYAAEGRLDLDAPVRSVVPGFRVSDPVATERATVRDLLTHVGGWEGDVFDDQGAGDDAVARYVAALAGAEQLAPYRTVWSYNNSAFVVAGRAVELVAGTSYEEALRQRVLEPLELGGCYIDPARVMTHRFASGHGVGEAGPRVLSPWPIGRYAHAAGGLACDVRSLLRYAAFHLGHVEAPEVLDAQGVAGMRAAVLTKHGTGERMAVTWHLSDVGDVELVGHGGGTLGQVSSLTLAPRRDFAFVLLTNADRGGQLVRAVRRAALASYLGVEETDPEPIEAEAEALAEYAGSYERPFAALTLKVEDGVLQASVALRRGFPNRDAPVPPPSPFFPLALYRQDGLVATEGPRQGATAEIIRRDDGSIGWIRLGGRIHRWVE